MADESMVLQTVRRYFEFSGADVERAEEIYHDDAVLEFPQSGERFEGAATFTEWRRQYPTDPGQVRYRIRRVTAGSIWLSCQPTRQSHSVSERITNPVLSLGVKKVDLGGISRPSRAVRAISATLTGRISTAAAARPLSTSDRVSASPCW